MPHFTIENHLWRLEGVFLHISQVSEVAADLLLGKSGELSGSLLRITYPQVCYIISTCWEVRNRSYAG